MSERRQLALLFAGLVALTAVGIVGASLFPESCSELEQLGELELAFTDAADALPLDEEAGAAVETLGEVVGVGGWRGAVALPDGAEVLPSEFGFFVVTDDAFTVLRPSLGIASAARGRVGFDVVAADGGSLALRAPDGTTGIFNGEYELDRCGTLPPSASVLAVEAGIAVVGGTGVGDVRLVTLSDGATQWSAEGVVAAHVAGEAVVLGDVDGLRLVETRTGEPLDQVTLERGGLGAWLEAGDDEVLRGLATGVLPVAVADGSLTPGEVVPLTIADGSLLDATNTPQGLVALVDRPEGTEVLVPGGPSTLLPVGVRARGLVQSVDGHLGVLLEVDGAVALAVYDAGL